MAQILPDDVWNEVAESAWSDRGALNVMSLTSRRMRLLFLPALFRSLKFDTQLLVLSDPKSGSFMASLIRNNMRARFLFNSPELLRHTHFFSFFESSHTVEWITEYLALREDPDNLGLEYLALQEAPDSSSSRDDAENLLAVLHDAIYRLVFRMPILRQLHISGTVITPLCYATISSRPHLTSLLLEPMRSPDIKYVTPAVPYTLRLRDFVYEYDTRTHDDSPADPCFTDIIGHCILYLEKLTMPSILLPQVVSRIPLQRTLPLRSLFVKSVNPERLDGPDTTTLWQVLRACPQLQHLEIDGQLSNVEPTHYLAPPILPKLSTIVGTFRLLQIVSGGTSLVKIIIDDSFHIKEQPITQIIRSPPTCLRELYMRGVVVSQTPQEFLTFIQSLAVFRNLENLAILYQQDMSWKKNVSAQDSHSNIKNLLHQLACLRFLDLDSEVDGFVDGYDIGCPISKQGDPANRGHPALERICVDFLCGPWTWDSRTGWEAGN